MSRTYDCREASEREDGLRTATTVIGRGALVVLPTDTLYGLAGDAFNPAAVTSLLAAKGRPRSMPPPVLIAGIDVLAALTTDLPDPARRLAEAFWPGGLTLIGWAQPSLAWDLGDTAGTVAVRVPDHPIALALLRSCGPLATSSANLSGHDPAATAEQAREQLGADVEVYLEVGELAASVPSTIVDATTERLVVVRQGAISVARLREVVPDIELAGDPAVQNSADQDQDQDPADQDRDQDPADQDRDQDPADQDRDRDPADPDRADQDPSDHDRGAEASPEPPRNSAGTTHYDARAEYTARHRETPTEL